MENQEQNLKLDPIQDNKDVKIIIEPLATQYRAIIEVDSKELEESFDLFWEKEGEKIVRSVGYKGRKQKGGKINLKEAKKYIEKHFGKERVYGSALTDLSLGFLNSETDGKEVMFINRFLLMNNEATGRSSILCFFYFWPKLIFEKEIDFVLEPRTKWDFESEFEKRCDSLKLQHKIKKSFEGEILTDDHEVLIDVISSCDDKPYAALTMRRSTFSIGNITNKALRESIKEHKVGDLFEISFENFVNDELKGKLVNSQVKIFEAYEIEYLDPNDDELYEVAGFEGKEDFRKSFKIQYENYVNNSRKYQAFDAVIDQFMLNGTLEPIPDDWIMSNVDNLYANHLKQFNGDKVKAMQALMVKDEPNMKKAFENQVFKETVSRMAVNAYAEKFNVKNDPEKVIEDILSRIIWKD